MGNQYVLKVFSCFDGEGEASGGADGLARLISRFQLEFTLKSMKGWNDIG